MAAQSKEQVDLLAFGKQFWDTWTGFAQQAMGGQTPNWGAPAEVFARVVPESMSDAGHATEAMAEQGRQFLEFIQAAAARMGAGESLDARGVAAMWKDGLAGGNPLLDALRAMNSEGSRGLEQAGKDLLELLAPMRQSIEAHLDTPTFGYSRERQQHWQALQRAASAHARAQTDYNALLLRASQRGMEYFENRLIERSEPGRQIDSPRALYDLWVDASEEAYAEVAMSPEFRTAYGELVNTQMRLRQCVQAEAEHQAAQLGMPTRSELDGTHRKIQQLAREVRDLRAALAAARAPGPTRPSAAGNTAPRSAPAATSRTAAKPKQVAKLAKTAKAAKSAKTAKTAKTASPPKPAKTPSRSAGRSSAKTSADRKSTSQKAKQPVQKSGARKASRRRTG